MHFEVPKAKSFKEFGGEYLMIVISIVTALALEHGVQTWHRRHVAAEAAVKIEQELRANVDEIANVQKHNQEQIHKLMAIRGELKDGIRNKTPDAVLMQRAMGEWRDAFTASIRSPALRRETWEAAVASQAASWLPDEALERYSRVYSHMREVQSIELGPNSGMDMTRYRDAMSNLEMGEGDPRELYRILNQLINAYRNNGNLEGLRDELKEVVGAAAAHGH